MLNLFIIINIFNNNLFGMIFNQFKIDRLLRTDKHLRINIITNINNSINTNTNISIFIINPNMFGMHPIHEIIIHKFTYHINSMF